VVKGRKATQQRLLSVNACRGAPHVEVRSRTAVQAFTSTTCSKPPKIMRLPSNGMGGLPGVEGSMRRSSTIFFMAPSRVALSCPFDPRKRHRFLGRGLDRATEIGDFAVGDIVAPSLAVQSRVAAIRRMGENLEKGSVAVWSAQ
jgi:hypothetical protein